MLGSSVELVLGITKDWIFMQYMKEEVAVGREMAEKEAMGVSNCDRIRAGGERRRRRGEKDGGATRADPPGLIRVRYCSNTSRLDCPHRFCPSSYAQILFVTE